MSKICATGVATSVSIYWTFQ